MRMIRSEIAVRFNDQPGKPELPRLPPDFPGRSQMFLCEHVPRAGRPNVSRCWDGVVFSASAFAGSPAIERTAICSAKTQVAPETNEAKKALTLLKQLVFEGQVVVGDAMFCQRDVELVFATAEAFLPSQQRELSEERARAATLNKAHGRVEHRELTSSTMLNDHLDWPGVKAGAGGREKFGDQLASQPHGR